MRLTPQDLTTAGATTTRTAIATANTYQVLLNSRGTVLNWRKTAAVDATITIVTPNTVDGLAIADREITVGATTGDVVARYFPDDYANGDGDLEFTASNEDGLTCAVLQR